MSNQQLYTILFAVYVSRIIPKPLAFIVSIIYFLLTLLNYVPMADKPLPLI
jgi:hypothetical protein